jgi:hypothetical protein
LCDDKKIYKTIKSYFGKKIGSENERCATHDEGNDRYHLPQRKDGRTLGKPKDKYHLLVPFSKDKRKVPNEKLKQGGLDLCSIDHEKTKEQCIKKAQGVFV